MLYETQFLIALCRSWLVEIPVLLLLAGIFWKTGRPSWGRIVGTGLITTALTLPYLWFVFPPYLDMRYYLLSGELIVIAIEAVLYWFLLGMRPRLAVVVSIMANAASFGGRVSASLVGLKMTWVSPDKMTTGPVDERMRWLMFPRVDSPSGGFPK